MECSNPGAIRDEELFAYLEGESVRPAVLRHLATCQYCSSQAKTYQRLELKLIKNLYRWDCPPNQVLGDYQFGLLSPQQSVEVGSHLSACVLCKSEVAQLTEFLANDPMLVPQSHVAVSAVRPVQEARRVLGECAKCIPRWRKTHHRNTATAATACRFRAWWRNATDGSMASPLHR